MTTTKRRKRRKKTMTWPRFVASPYPVAPAIDAFFCRTTSSTSTLGSFARAVRAVLSSTTRPRRLSRRLASSPRVPTTTSTRSPSRPTRTTCRTTDLLLQIPSAVCFLELCSCTRVFSDRLRAVTVKSWWTRPDLVYYYCTSPHPVHLLKFHRVQ